MKILFTNNYAYLRGGSERVMFDEMALLARHEQESCIFSRQHPDNDTWGSASFFPPHLNYDGGGLSTKIRSAKELIYSKTVGIYLKNLIAHERPDLMHAHNIYGRMTTAIFDTAIRAGVPSVLTLHDYKLVCPSYLLMREKEVCELCVTGGPSHCLRKRCHKGSLAASAVYVAGAYYSRIFKKYEQVKYFICPSKFILNKHAEGGLPQEKLVYIPNVIDVNKFQPRFEHDGYILFVGRLSREKGVRTLLSSMIGLDIPLKIVGDGPLRQDLEALVREKDMKQVSFEGYQSGDNLTNLFKDAAFLVFPSEWYENAPMTILEAYGYGKAVIGADIGGIPEMIIDGETGLLFAPGDVDMLRDKIASLWSDKARVTDMGKNARRRVETEYNSDLHYKRLMGVYEKAMEGAL